jgi:type III secretory pathway component EscS
MQLIQQGYRGLSLIFVLNYDRIIIPIAIVVGLVGGAMIGFELTQLQPQDMPSVH